MVWVTRAFTFATPQRRVRSGTERQLLPCEALWRWGHKYGQLTLENVWLHTTRSKWQTRLASWLVNPGQPAEMFELDPPPRETTSSCHIVQSPLDAMTGVLYQSKNSSIVTHADILIFQWPKKIHILLWCRTFSLARQLNHWDLKSEFPQIYLEKPPSSIIFSQSDYWETNQHPLIRRKR